MKPFANVRDSPSATFFAMFVWALGLVFGAANACLLKTSGLHPNTATNHMLDGGHADDLAPQAVPADAITFDSDHNADASRELCI